MTRTALALAGTLLLLTTAFAQTTPRPPLTGQAGAGAAVALPADYFDTQVLPILKASCFSCCTGEDGHAGHGTAVFSARLPSGNTLMGGSNDRVFEVDPSGKTVWSIDRDELPGIKLYRVTDVEVLPNGNIVFGNCHAREENPQVIEVTRGKKVVWTLKDGKNLGDNTATAIVFGEPGVLR